MDTTRLLHAAQNGTRRLSTPAEPLLGWPRLALLGVGEVLAASAAELRIALHENSGTTRALTHTGKARLSLVLDGSAYRIRLATGARPCIQPVAPQRTRRPKLGVGDRMCNISLTSEIVF